MAAGRFVPVFRMLGSTYGRCLKIRYDICDIAYVGVDLRVLIMKNRQTFGLSPIKSLPVLCRGEKTRTSDLHVPNVAR